MYISVNILKRFGKNGICVKALLKQWWEIGKINIKLFCQQHTAYSTNKLRESINSIEKDISSIEVEPNWKFYSKKKRRTGFTFE